MSSYIEQAIRNDLETSQRIYDLLSEKHKNDAYYKSILTNDYNEYSLVEDYTTQTYLNGTLTQISYYLAAFTTLYLAAFLSQVFPAAIMLSNVAQLILPLATAASVAIVHAHKAYANRSFDDVISKFCNVYTQTRLYMAIENTAANKISSIYRRHKAKNKAATKIQSLLRTRMPKKLLHGLKKDKEDNARREKNVSTLQTWASGLKNKPNAATTINNAYRAYKARNELKILKQQKEKKTTLLADLKQTVTKNNAAIKIQSLLRTIKPKQLLQGRRDTAKAAERTAVATRIQSVFRTYLAKNKLESLKTENNAATKIQSLLRTIKPKQLLQSLKDNRDNTARRENNVRTLQTWASGLNQIKTASIEAGNNQPVSSQSFSNVAEEKTTASAALSPNTKKARQYASASLGSQNPKDRIKTADLYAELAKKAANDASGKKSGTPKKRSRKQRRKANRGHRQSPRPSSSLNQ